FAWETTGGNRFDIIHSGLGPNFAEYTRVGPTPGARPAYATESAPWAVDLYFDPKLMTSDIEADAIINDGRTFNVLNKSAAKSKNWPIIGATLDADRLDPAAYQYLADRGINAIYVELFDDAEQFDSSTATQDALEDLMTIDTGWGRSPIELFVVKGAKYRVDEADRDAEQASMANSLNSVLTGINSNDTTSRISLYQPETNAKEITRYVDRTQSFRFGDWPNITNNVTQVFKTVDQFPNFHLLNYFSEAADVYAAYYPTLQDNVTNYADIGIVAGAYGALNPADWVYDALPGAGGNEVRNTFMIHKTIGRQNVDLGLSIARGHAPAYNRIIATLPTAEMGQGTHTGQAIILSEELGVQPETITIEMPPRPTEAYRLFFGQMRSVGSYGIRAWYDPLRTAAAQAREVLIHAASQQTSLPKDELSAKDGFIVHQASDKKIPFGDLVAVAATLPVPEQPTLLTKGQRKVSMADKRRLDIPAKTDGSAVFGTDVKIDNMLHGAVRMSPVYGAEVKSFDRDSIKDMPGVVEIAEIPNGVVVIADSWWRAKKAADALTIEFTETPNDQLDSATLSQQMRDGLSDEMPPVLRKGDAQEKLAAAETVTESVYEVPFLTHGCMEPLVCTALEEQDHVTLWMPTQGHDIVRMAVEKVSGFKNEQMTIHTTYLGGGFGRKTHGEIAEQAILASRAVKRPVKVMWSREDDVQQGYYRPIMTSRLRAAVAEDGKINAMHIQLSGPQMGRTFEHVTVKDNNDFFSVAVLANQPYADDFALDHRHLDVPMPLSPWRAVSSSQNGYFLEAFIDELASKAEMDPIAFRRLNLAGQKRHLAVLDKVAEMSEWDNSRAAGIHKGIAVVESYGSVIAQVVEIEMQNETPKVNKVHVAIDCGWALQPDAVVAQMEGSVIEGLAAALRHQIPIKDGRAQRSNFHDYQFLRMNETPEIAVEIVDTGAPMGGVGEPGIPPLAPALVNAIFSATQKRL
ncbi:MAG: molybdopterin cofactor-binding domain-containing protein, partial [Pseudomonadota bacterium]